MVFVAVEVSPVGSKPPAAVVVRISKGGRHNLGAAAPLSTRASSLGQRSAGRPVHYHTNVLDVEVTLRFHGRKVRLSPRAMAPCPSKKNSGLANPRWWVYIE